MGRIYCNSSAMSDLSHVRFRQTQEVIFKFHSFLTNNDNLGLVDKEESGLESGLEETESEENGLEDGTEEPESKKSELESGQEETESEESRPEGQTQKN